MNFKIKPSYGMGVVNEITFGLDDNILVLTPSDSQNHSWI